MAGGVTKTGTLRNIHLNRNATTIDTIDLYPLISKAMDHQQTKFD